MDKKGQATIIILMILIVGLVLAFAMGWISIGKEVSTTPEKDELPDVVEEEPEEKDITDKFQECTTASDCNWDPSIYYNRDCVGEWRCMDSPYAGIKLCTYGCQGSEYCGDGICGGYENGWSCPDCNPDVGFIGELEI